MATNRHMKAPQAPPTTSALIDDVLALVVERHPADRVAHVSELVRQFFRDVDPEDLRDRDAVDLYGAAVSLWRFARRRDPDATLLRVYNPSVAEHGWQCPHTVVEIVRRDIPFLVDSVRMQINAAGFISHLIIHPILTVRRDAEGQALAVLPRGETAADARPESFMHLEISRETDPETLRQLEEGLTRSLADVRAAVDDWKPMVARMGEVVEAARRDPPRSLAADEVSEGLALLEWLMRDRFTFLGCRDYALEGPEGETELHAVAGSGLGILRDSQHEGPSASFAVLPASARERARRPEFLIQTKSNSRATVHRRAYADYVEVKHFDRTGTVVGARRFLGLYTSVAYSTSVLEIPVLRRKVRAVIDRAGMVPGSHRAKALLTILETYPRDELFQIGEEQLLRIATGILHLAERQRTRLFMRRDPFGRFVSALVFVPRDNHTTTTRERIEALLVDALDGVASDSSVNLSESVLARLLIVVHMRPGATPDYDERALEAEIAQIVRRWEDDLAEALTARFGEEHGMDLFRAYGEAFPAGYREDVSARAAVHDIKLVEQLAAGDDDLALNLYVPLEAAEGELRFKLLRRGRAMALSDVLPILECMGVRVLDERPYELEPKDATRVWLHDVGLATGGLDIDLDAVRAKFHEAFLRVWRGDAEGDSFNALVLRAGLSWREITVLRALARYARQTGFMFSQAYMESTLAAHPAIARQMIALFLERHDPDRPEPPGERGTARARRIEEALEQVPSLDEDRILRRFLMTILATTRTNYFQRRPDGAAKPYLALKFDPFRIPGLPEPRPMFEIYVYAPRVEGVHLRGGRIARGGLRWSDRMEDFRTEVLGLMKAQMAKNAVIVPVGAKGGFVVKTPPAGRDALRREVADCYTTFLRGLLDLTDSREGTEVVPPPRVVRHDPDDSYLVVAADKGTASFSDLANGVAAEYAFWLGDAFASGGSTGYDHRRMGITARGAWESVCKHFRALGVDVQAEPFTVAGIGDMSGDVFGSGMLRSRHTRLVAAFDHRHVFLDPDPDPEASYRERKRLSRLPRSSWADYDASLVSSGGGVYPRTAKSIPLSPQVRAGLAVDAEVLTPAELIQAILRAPVDLLYNGGVGTYVKASDETHGDVGDRSNDAVRVNAGELRCRVVGEGGNLGFTQRARIEYALAGGRVYTDAIDNAAGVNCSDHEVNIKTLLREVTADGRLTAAQRNQLLETMTDEVAALVLQSNYAQAQALSIGRARTRSLFSLQTRFIRYLERRGALSREIEALPSDETIDERKAADDGLTTPELAVLLAHAKVWLFDQLLESDVPEDPFVASALTEYFPAVLGERYSNEMARHPLRREIIATHVCNALVNTVGSTFVHRLSEETGSAPAQVVRAFLITRAVYDLDAVWGRVDALDNVVADGLQTSIQIRLVKLVERVTRWFLRHPVARSETRPAIARYSSSVRTVAASLASVLGEDEHQRLEQTAAELAEGGVPRGLADEVASADHLYAALDICDVAGMSDRTLACVTGVYFLLAERLDAPWFRERIAMLPTDTHWQTLARAALRNELAERLRKLTAAVLASAPGTDEPAALLAAWEESCSEPLARVRQVLGELQTIGSPDLAMLSVGVRELRSLA